MNHKPKTDDQGGTKQHIVTKIEGHVFLIGINRPHKYNAFTKQMFADLATALTEFEKSEDLWCAMIYAEGKHFTAGLQLDTFNITDTLGPADLVDPFALRGPVRKKPLVVAVQGICFTAGIELMLAADIVVAADDCRFAQLEVKRGLMPFGGATIRMVERAGWGNAMRHLLTGDEFNAEEAYRIGFVQEVVAAGEQYGRALELATAISKRAPIAVQETLASAQISQTRGQDAAVEAFDGQLKRLAGTEDFMEGVRSFLERREGEFKGK
jgi:enoyl-CoA hydratase